MTAYRALVVTPSGRQTWEEVEAATRAEVVSRLSIEGLVAIDVRPARSGLAGKLTEPITLSRGVGIADQAMLLTQLALLVRFGLPVDRSIDLLRDQSAKGALRDALDRTVIKVRAGESLSQAFASQKILPDYAVGVIRAAEQTGKLGDALATLAEQLTASATTRRHLITALTYPALVLVSTILALGIVLTLVVPAFAPIFAGNEAQLPTLTLWVLRLSALIESWGWLIAAMLVAIVAGFLWIIMAQDQSERAAAFARRLPFRELRLQYRGAQLLAVLGTLLTNGLTVVDALPLTAKATRSSEWRHYLLGAEQTVREGNSLSAALSIDPLFPRTAIRLLEVGERGGSLGLTCLKASTIMAEAAKARIDRAVALANPLAIITLGALVAMLVAGVMLGIFSLGDFVQ